MPPLGRWGKEGMPNVEWMDGWMKASMMIVAVERKGKKKMLLLSFGDLQKFDR